LEQLSNHSASLLSVVTEVETAEWPVRNAQNNCKAEPPFHQAQKRLDPEQAAELVAGFVDDEEIKDLAAQYGINRTTVLAHLKRQRRSELMPADIEKVIELYAVGWTIETIGPELRVGASTIRRALLKAGVEIRRRGHAGTAIIRDYRGRRR
jgi:hypothetical protein